MSEWQKRLAALCDATLGGFSEAVYAEIVDAVLAEIDAAYERGRVNEVDNHVCQTYAD